MPIEGAISYAGYRFLSNYHSLLLFYKEIIQYIYEPCFDLRCVINIIMCKTDRDIEDKINVIKRTSSFAQKY